MPQLQPLRPFRMPPSVRPTFDPEMMELPEAYVSRTSPVPLAPLTQMPDAAPPPRPPSEDARALAELKAMGPPKASTPGGWRGFLAAGLRGGLPGVASEALQPGLAREQEEYALKERHLEKLASLEDRERMRANQEENTQALRDYRTELANDRGERERLREDQMILGLGEEVQPGELVDAERYEYRDYGGKRYRKERKQPNPVEVSPGASLIDPRTGKVVSTAPGREPAPLRPLNVSRGGTLVGPDGTVVYQDTRPPARGGDSGPKPASPNSFRVIETWKQQQLAEAEARARKRAEEDPGNQQVWADLEADKRRIQQGYEAQINAANGQPGAPASPQRQTVSRRAILARAQKEGLDPNAALEAAKRLNVTIVD